MQTAVDADPSEDLDLDTRISIVEQRLIAREQRLLDQVRHLGKRVTDAAAPRALLIKGAGVALAGAGLYWGLRRGGRARSQPAAAQASSHRPSGVTHLIGLVTMAWPMLPARWRGKVSPATAATVLGLAGPVLERLMARSSHPEAHERDDPPTVPHLDLVRYAGIWHEQARLPVSYERACRGRPRAIYALRGGRLGVHNECHESDGSIRVADGAGRVVPGSGGARLQVSFAPEWLQWLPHVWGDLWILHVDDSAPDYRVAIAGDPSRKGLWLLSRAEHLPADELQRLVLRAGDLGYDTTRLIFAEPAAASI